MDESVSGKKFSVFTNIVYAYFPTILKGAFTPLVKTLSPIRLHYELKLVLTQKILLSVILENSGSRIRRPSGLLGGVVCPSNFNDVSFSGFALQVVLMGNSGVPLSN